MIKLEIAALFAGINLLILIVTAVRVTLSRRANKVSLGDGGNPAVLRAMRAHGNAAENIPAAIGAMLILSLLDPVPMWQLQVFGALFTIGRIVHAYGVSTYTGIGPGNGRVAGMAMSWAALIAMALALIWGAIAQTV